MQLILGNCLELFNTLSDKSIDVILTDPPYNFLPFKGENVSFKTRKRALNHLEEWDRDHIKPLDWLVHAKRVLKDDGNLIAFCGENQIGEYCDYCNDNFDVFLLGVWHKTNPTPCIRKKTFLKSIDHIVFAWNKGHRWNFFKQTEMHNYFEYPIVGGKERFIKVQKPLRLLSKILSITSNENDLILDPFMGSGSTGVACKKLKRDFIGFELNDINYNIAVKRINDGGV